MLDDIMITLKFHFWHKNVIILSLCMHVVMDVITFFRKSVNHFSGLSILLHGVISLPDAASG